MTPSSKLLLAERAIPDTVTPDALVRAHLLGDLNMLVRNGGRERTEAEYRALLAAADMRLARTIPTGTEFSLVEAAPV
jgi:hypothetical protein